MDITPPIRGIDHVQVVAPPGAEHAARRFYGSLLGLEERPKPPGVAGTGGVWFRCGVQELHVGVADPHTPAVRAHPALAVEPGELTALAARLERAGLAVEWDARIAGVSRFFVSDPFGNRIELLAAPAGRA